MSGFANQDRLIGHSKNKLYQKGKSLIWLPQKISKKSSDPKKSERLFQTQKDKNIKNFRPQKISRGPPVNLFSSTLPGMTDYHYKGNHVKNKNSDLTNNSNKVSFSKIMVNSFSQLLINSFGFVCQPG